MPQGLRTTALTLALLAGGAQAQHALHCRDLDPQAPEDAYRAFECVSKLNADLEDAMARIGALEASLARIDRMLEKVQPVPAVGDHEATRAIVAYYSDKGEKRCPDGWSPYEEAKDRFILGAGGDIPTVGAVGGEAQVTLKEEEMPSHDHSARLQSWRDSLANGNPGTEVLLKNLNLQGERAGWASLRTDKAGGDQPHNNMPPFIALYYCKKN